MNLGGKRQVYEFIKDVIEIAMDVIVIAASYLLMFIGTIALELFLITTFPLWIIPYMIHNWKKSK